MTYEPYIKETMSVTILGIESSCDDTSAAVLRDTVLLSTPAEHRAGCQRGHPPGGHRPQGH